MAPLQAKQQYIYIYIFVMLLSAHVKRISGLPYAEFFLNVFLNWQHKQVGLVENVRH